MKVVAENVKERLVWIPGVNTGRTAVHLKLEYWHSQQIKGAFEKSSTQPSGVLPISSPETEMIAASG
jgi:hypothetical protein